MSSALGDKLLEALHFAKHTTGHVLLLLLPDRMADADGQEKEKKRQ